MNFPKEHELHQRRRAVTLALALCWLHLLRLFSA